VPPHNDRGRQWPGRACFAGGADRLEGTLSQRRTHRQLDIVTVALNLFSQGIDPGWTSTISTPSGGWPSTLPASGSPASPNAGELVYTAFLGLSPGRDQKRDDGLPPTRQVGGALLPIDPKHTGRTYEAIIRVNSQSGKGGLAYIMGAEHGLDLPRRLQVEFSRAVQG